MSELATVITKALARHGGWIRPLQLRDLLPNGQPRGEPFDLALNQLVHSRRVETRCDDGTTLMVRLADAPPATVTAPAAITAPGPAAAVAEAFNPARPSLRIPLVGDPDEVRRPRPQPSRQESRMPSKGPTKPEQIMTLLAKKPMTKAELAAALGATPEATYFHMKNLAKADKIHRTEAGTWALLNGKGPQSPPPAKAKKLVTGIEDLDLKLQVLSMHIDAANEADRKISAFVLARIRDDLERLAA